MGSAGTNPVGGEAGSGVDAAMWAGVEKFQGSLSDGAEFGVGISGWISGIQGKIH